MGDSEDEYDRKRRDKFRGERAEVSYRGAERVARPRDEWSERESWTRPRPRDYRGGVRDRAYSPSMEPAPKRMRHDYYGDSYYGHYTPYHQAAHRAANFFREPASSAQNEGSTPPMMSFKAFLATQDDNISESEAIEKYNDYKLEFQRQQLNEFFVAHKDDEWFRLKYHPEDSVKRKEEQMAALKKRVEVFMNILEAGKLDNVSVDCSKTNPLLHLLDTVVVKLEGGNDEDLSILDQEYAEIEEKSKEQLKPRETENSENKSAPTVTPQPQVVKTEDEVENKLEVDKPDEEHLEQNGKEENGEVETTAAPSKIKEEAEEEANQPVREEEENNVESKVEDKKQPPPSPRPDDSEEASKKRKRSYSGSSSSSSSNSTDGGVESDGEEHPKPTTEPSNEKPTETPSENAEKKDESEDKIETIEDDKLDKPRDALHKTTSIFLRNLAPTITKQEVEAICSRYSHFLRVALAEPQPERRWMRRGWVTFKRNTNIKEICWNLNNIRLRDCELGAIVNRDLSKRIRPVNGITAHKQIVRSDINVASRVILHLDEKVGLWNEVSVKGETNKNSEELSFGIKSKNPVLHNITDYLIEEASAEEEELLGLEPCSENQESSVVDRDETLIKVLDKIILYLRIVHSVDYYNHCEYPNEDEMPNRCGILHARGPAPTAKVTDMSQFMGASVENKMSAFLPEKKKSGGDGGEAANKNEQKLIQLSLKDQDTEIDKFVQANTRELAKDKWLCPLSGKKFKGPDFVRKHIFNKHAEKIEEVKKEVEFFNNYLKDPKRPMLTDAPHNKREEIQAPFNHSNNYSGGGGGGGGAPAGGYSGGYGRPMPYNNYYAQRTRGYAPRTRGSPADYRPVIHYRDLDAPREPEEFI